MARVGFFALLLVVVVLAACCMHVADGKRSRRRVRVRVDARSIPGWDSMVKDAANKVKDAIETSVKNALSSIRTGIENDVFAAKSTAENAVSSVKNTALTQCKNAVDLATGPFTTFAGKLDNLGTDLSKEVDEITTALASSKTILEEFGKAIATFFTAAFDINDEPPACTVPPVFAEVNKFFNAYLGVQPLDSNTWCRFMGIAAKFKMDGAFTKLFTVQRTMFKSPSLLELESQVGEGGQVSLEVLSASVDWNVINVVFVVFDGAVDIVAQVLAAVDSGPVDKAAQAAAQAAAPAKGLDKQLLAAAVATVFKLVSAGLKAAAVAKGCTA